MCTCTVHIKHITETYDDGGTSIQVTVEGGRSKEKRQSSESPEAPSSTPRVPLLDLTTLAPENNSSGKASITCFRSALVLMRSSLFVCILIQCLHLQSQNWFVSVLFFSCFNVHSRFSFIPRSRYEANVDWELQMFLWTVSGSRLMAPSGHAVSHSQSPTCLQYGVWRLGTRHAILPLPLVVYFWVPSQWGLSRQSHLTCLHGIRWLWIVTARWRFKIHWI